MTRRYLMMALPLLFCFSTPVPSQDGLAHLKSWDGKRSQRIDENGKVASDFFTLSEVRTPLRRLLSADDYRMFMQAYGTGSPLRLIGDVLAAKSACFPPVGICPGGAGFAINLRNGNTYVRMQDGTKERWIVSTGKAVDLTKEVRDFIGKPTRRRP